MGNTYSQIYIHSVFAVRNRENFILESWEVELYKYISGIITKEKAKSLCVGGWKDHVHVFFGLPVTSSVATILQHIKANSSRWINENNFIRSKFQWQDGYGAFSHSKSERDRIIQYILDQKDHHHHKSFREEYLKTLKDFNVEFDPKYLFEFYD
jgi:putative transposase